MTSHPVFQIHYGRLKELLLVYRNYTIYCKIMRIPTISHDSSGKIRCDVIGGFAIYPAIVLTDGGCTESTPTQVRTDPTQPSGQQPPVATPHSQTYISVLWQRPLRPNGPGLRYELARMKIRQPLQGEHVSMATSAAQAK